jgi:hypothetical protein
MLGEWCNLWDVHRLRSVQDTPCPLSMCRRAGQDLCVLRPSGPNDATGTDICS